jgi:flagellar biosynthesis chaperone FliJ
MPHDPLATLIKVRRLACDDALRKLSDALADEDRAERGFHEIERTIAEEMAAASDPDGSDAMVEAFGAWLPRARQQLESARRVLSDRQAETVRVRAELTACRTALESVETLQQQRRDAARQALEHAHARDIDDRPRRSPDGTEEPTDQA